MTNCQKKHCYQLQNGHSPQNAGSNIQSLSKAFQELNYALSFYVVHCILVRTSANYTDMIIIMAINSLFWNLRLKNDSYVSLCFENDTKKHFAF